jgi:hypothetical protein
VRYIKPRSSHADPVELNVLARDSGLSKPQLRADERLTKCKKARPRRPGFNPNEDRLIYY